MKVHVLGAGSAQLGIIRRCKELGHTVIVSDYLSDAPGKLLADYSTMASTFDVQEVLRVSREYVIDGILTIGTDQPVLTAAKTASAMGIPTYLTVDQALAVTHKRVMKQLFASYGIPTCRWVCVGRDFSSDLVTDLDPPYVMKPLDSQGQRGVFKVNTVDEIRLYAETTLDCSREDEFLIEEYYPHNEITVSGWIHRGRTTILTITDRITRDTPPSIGICFAHRYPSIYADESDMITRLTERVVEVLGLREGPLYVQLLRGADGYKVNEVACRIGGAYEEYVIPAVTGVPIVDMQIQLALGETPDPMKWFDGSHASKAGALVLLFFVRSGTVAEVGDADAILELPGVLACEYFLRPGDVVGSIRNATQRAGFVVMAVSDRLELDVLLEEVESRLVVRDENWYDMIISYEDIL